MGSREEVRIRHPSGARYVTEAKHADGRTVYVDTGDDPSDIFGKFNHSDCPTYTCVVTVRVNTQGKTEIRFKFQRNPLCAITNGEVTICYGAAYVFDRPAADPDDDDEDDSQSYTERLETNKKKTDAELQFKQLYKQRAPCMHKKGAPMRGAADEDRCGLKQVFHLICDELRISKVPAVRAILWRSQMITETYLAELRDHFKSDPSFDFNSVDNILKAADRRDPARQLGSNCPSPSDAEDELEEWGYSTDLEKH
eukprot:SAG25_NODE_365_length_9126_cov_7.904952_3_plen_254_part_00